MSRWLGLALVAFCMLLLGSVAGARTWIVALDGSGDFTLISAACTAAASGDSIRIRPGQYDEPEYSGSDKPWFRVFDKSLTLLGDGVDPTDVLITFAVGVSRVLSNTSFVAQGLSFKGPAGRLGVYANRLEVGRCVFEGTGDGPPAGWGEMPLKSYPVESALVHDCVFRGNIAYGYPSAIDAYGPSQTIRNCRFEDNTTDGQFSGALRVTTDSQHPCTVDHCVFLRNTSPQGAAICGDRTIVTYCTFYGNDGGCMYMNEYAYYVSYSIIAATRNGGLDRYPPENTILLCSDLWGNEYGDPPPGWHEEGCFSLDPLLCEPTNGDVTLHADSPCVNAPGCGQVGAEGVGCGETATTVMTWGRIKTTFRDATR